MGPPRTTPKKKLVHYWNSGLAPSEVFPELGEAVARNDREAVFRFFEENDVEFRCLPGTPNVVSIERVNP